MTLVRDGNTEEMFKAQLEGVSNKAELDNGQSQPGLTVGAGERVPLLNPQPTCSWQQWGGERGAFLPVLGLSF